MKVFKFMLALPFMIICVPFAAVSGICMFIVEHLTAD